ncbi:MAG: hypothetical protein DHS20C14_08690 [Phycisphaeraceae bacterium]|nr:MAG: hypothetical protein DHS20C14_08690 [Phycisphaeraceae bacterium]
MSRRPAFSLVELIIVVVIIGIGAAIAVPRYGRSLNRYRAQLAAERVAEELRFAAEHARSREIGVDATVDTGADSLTLVESTGSNAGDVVGTLRVDEAPYGARLFLALRESGLGSPAFDAQGVPDADAIVVVMAGDMYVVVALYQGDPSPQVWPPRVWGGSTVDVSSPSEPAGTSVATGAGLMEAGP